MERAVAVANIVGTILSGRKHEHLKQECVSAIGRLSKRTWTEKLESDDYGDNR